MSRGNQEKPAPIPSWLRLDNAAKIYPAARTKSWMPLFRVSMTLKEEADPGLLQQALDKTLKRIPLFAYRLRRGFFWYYFEKQKKQPRVESDSRNPMLPINLTGSQGFQFRLRCHKRRVALEVFHALADGYGATVFLTTLMAEYLFLRYGRRIPAGSMVLDTGEQPQRLEWEDSFPRYARVEATRSRAEEAAWHFRGTKEPGRHLRVVTGILPTDSLHEVAKAHKTTVNGFLAALYLQALIRRKKESRRGQAKPVKLSLPVNLRKYYPSKTLRNFSFYVNVPVRTDYADYTLDQLILIVRSYMAIETLEPLLNARFSGNVKAEQNPLLRMAPLFLKTAALKIMYKATGERYMTSTLTNLGQMNIPEEMAKHLERMDLVLGPAKQTPISCGVISAGGVTSITFSKNRKETEIERDFFTSLVGLGIPVTIESN
jgi:NRPS condensation-like uncharacterized protein